MGFNVNTTGATIKGQATIPKHIREYLGITPGKSDVDFVIVDNHVEVVNNSVYNPFAKARGLTKGKMTTDQIMGLTRG